MFVGCVPPLWRDERVSTADECRGMSVRPFNGFAGVEMANGLSSAASRDPRDDQMDQIRDLLFGEYKRLTDEKFAAIEARLATLEARVHALAGEQVASRRDTLDDLSRGIEELGAYVRRLSRPGPA